MGSESQTVASASLPPIVHPKIRQLLDLQAPLIRQLVHGCGSPLHIVLPQIFADNATGFSRVLRDSAVSGGVLFAKKANKAQCFTDACADLGLGIDAASAAEVSAALSAGVRGGDIGISGPAKTVDLLRLALRHGCLVAIDDVQELQGFAALARELGCCGRTLLRIRSDLQTTSRFGMNDTEAREALRLCAATRDQLQLEGFSFHLAGYSAGDRARMAHRLIGWCLDARALDLPCRTINIGGGFGVRYVEEAHWNTFLATHQPAHYHAGKRFTDFYPYHCASHGPGMLQEILTAPATTSDARATLAARCIEHGIQILLEPGRALLDQAGFSAFRIQGLKDRAAQDGYGILTAEGTSFSLSEQWFNSEFLPDPLLLGAADEASSGAGYSACVGGASCLDADMLTWRKIRFPRQPARGDVLIYINTAGYQMDSNESPFHDLPLPRKVAITLTHDTACWHLDGVSGRRG